jgi:hypothetical protein
VTAAPLHWDEATLDGAVWQGIRFLSFDSAVPGFEAVVTAHLARPANGIAEDDVLVEGGERITGLGYEVGFPAADLIELRFPSRGDRSDYTVRLAQGGLDPLHPFFDRASFNFYIDCPGGDCRPLDAQPAPPPPQRPAIDLKTKDYAGFVSVLADWIKVRSPDWGDLAPASFERMLLELLSHHADQLSYFQDRVANEAFLDTARERHAVRQHGLLLGYALREPVAARAVVGFDVTNPGVLPAGVVVDHSEPEGDPGPVYTTREAVRLDPRHNGGAIVPAAFPGAAAAVVPEGSTNLLLFGHDLGLTPNQRLAFRHGDAAAIVTLVEVAELQLPGWTASPADPPVAVLADVTRIAWREPLGQALRPWLDPFSIRGNLVNAVHGAPRRAVASPTGAAPPGALAVVLDRQNSIVAPRRLADGTLIWLLRALRPPEWPILFDGSGGGIEVQVDGELWSREPNLWESRSYDLHYVAETDEAGAVWLQFGDGVHGHEIEALRDGPFAARPAVEVSIRYRTGAAAAGNCAADTLDRIPPVPPGSPIDAALTALGVTAVGNVVPGTGGTPAEPLDQARFAIPDSLKHGPRERAVTLADYAEGARIDGVARAAAVDVGGAFNTVRVLVDPVGQGSLPADLRDRVFRRIDDLRMAGREHLVAAPAYVAIEVSLAVCAAAPRLRTAVRTRVLAALRPGREPPGGYFHPDRLSFGESPSLGDLLAYVQGLPEVLSVKALAFRRLDDPSPVRVREAIAIGALEVARLDADDSRPENGVLQVLVVGLDDVDESAFDIGGPVADPEQAVP